jgi:hypothetical protein
LISERIAGTCPNAVGLYESTLSLPLMTGDQARAGDNAELFGVALGPDSEADPQPDPPSRKPSGRQPKTD